MGGPFVIIFLALAGGAIYGSTKTNNYRSIAEKSCHLGPVL
jgi:hypothetical protein